MSPHMQVCGARNRELGQAGGVVGERGSLRVGYQPSAQETISLSSMVSH